MTAKEYLQQYLQAEHSINSKLEQVARLRSLAVKTTQSIVDCRVRGAPKNRMENIISRIIDLEKQVDSEIDRLCKIRQQIEDVIQKVSKEEYRQVLRYRYINGLTFEEIAKAMNYSWRWIMELHGRALKEIKECIELHI